MPLAKRLHLTTTPRFIESVMALREETMTDPKQRAANCYSHEPSPGFHYGTGVATVIRTWYFPVLEHPRHY